LQVFYLEEDSSTSYAGHAFGGLAGLLVGAILLENRKVDDWEKIFKWVAVGLYWALILAFILWHVIGTFEGYFPEQE
jgi:polyferredoxin